MSGSALPTELEKWQPSEELERWRPGFETTKLVLTRSTRKDILLPGLGWAARSCHAWDGAAWSEYVVQNGLVSDTYVSVDVGDLVVPSTWDPDGQEWRVKRDAGGWTHAKVLRTRDNKVVEGWLPCEIIDRARQEGFEITYAQLYLGLNDEPIPHPCEHVEPVPQYHKCHATLGYLAPLPDHLMNWAIERGNRLIKKYWHDGYLPAYAFKPEISENGEVINGLCHFKVPAVSSKNVSTYNSFRSMMDGRVAQPIRFPRLPALFSDFLLEPGYPLIGSLDERSPLFDLCRHISHFLDFEVYGQHALGSPFLTLVNSAWVVPHITLSAPLVADRRTRLVATSAFSTPTSLQ